MKAISDTMTVYCVIVVSDPDDLPHASYAFNTARSSTHSNAKDLRFSPVQIAPLFALPLVPVTRTVFEMYWSTHDQPDERICI